MKFTYKSLSDFELIFDTLWARHDWRGKAKPSSSLPQEVTDAMTILYDWVEADLRKGERRHLLPYRPVSRRCGMTIRRAADALERLLRYDVLRLTEDQPAKGKRYEVNPVFVHEVRVQIRSLVELREFVAARTGSTDRYWKAYGAVRQAGERATVKRMTYAIESLDRNTARRVVPSRNKEEKS